MVSGCRFRGLKLRLMDATSARNSHVPKNFRKSESSQRSPGGYESFGGFRVSFVVDANIDPRNILTCRPNEHGT